MRLRERDFDLVRVFAILIPLKYFQNLSQEANVINVWMRDAQIFAGRANFTRPNGYEDEVEIFIKIFIFFGS